WLPTKPAGNRTKSRFFSTRKENQFRTVMSQFIHTIPFLLGGLIFVTLIDTVGAYASRRFNFNFGVFAIGSLLIYTFMGYFLTKKVGLSMTVFTSLAIAFYDATIGWKLSRKLKPKTGLSE